MTKPNDPTFIDRVRMDPDHYRGRTLSDIAAELGCTRQNVSLIADKLEEEGISIGVARGRTGPKRGSIHRGGAAGQMAADPDRFAGKTISQIAEELHLSYSVVASSIRKLAKLGIVIKWKQVRHKLTMDDKAMIDTDGIRWV